MKKSYFKWGAISKRQAKVLTWWLPESGVADAEGIICDGAIRSGKTVCMALAYVQWSMASFNGQNFGMCGKTVGSFRRNVLSVLKQMLLSRGYKLSDRRSENLVTISRGAVTNYYYVFGGKDEGSQDLIQGITLAGVLLDEVVLMPQSFVEQATGRCSVAGSKFWFNCNPEGPEHWFKKEWIDKLDEKKMLYLHFTQEDNLSLAEEVKARYRAMYTGIFYQRFVLGEWCVAEGLIYQFDKDLHIAKELPKEGTWYISVDYGTLNPFSAGLWCVNSGRAVRVAEYYHSGRGTNRQMTDEEYYTKLEELAGERSIYHVIVDPSAASFIATIRKHGRFSVRKARNEVLDGIRLTAAMLQTGVITIGAGCKDAIREFDLYRWDEKGEQDKPIKENDHAMDEIRYFCSTVMRRDKTARRIMGGLLDEED